MGVIHNLSKNQQSDRVRAGFTLKINADNQPLIRPGHLARRDK